MSGEYCGEYLGYRYGAGAKAYCGDDVGTHIVYCQKCKKKQHNTNSTKGEVGSKK